MGVTAAGRHRLDAEASWISVHSRATLTCMRFRDLFEQWGLKGIKLTAGFAELEWAPEDSDRDAAWDLYVELLTRSATQPLPDDVGIERTALESVHSLFPTTRAVLKTHGRKAERFARVAIVVLNQVVRPFTARWHRPSESGALAGPEQTQRFRVELAQLRSDLLRYTAMLAAIAGVEDLSSLEAPLGLPAVPSAEGRGLITREKSPIAQGKPLGQDHA